MNIIRNMIISAVLLAMFAIAGTGIVTFVFDNTIDRINENKRHALLNAFHVLISPSEHDNDIYSDTIQRTNKALLGSRKAITIYRVRKNNKNIAVIINSVAPDGYSGDIEMLVAIKYSGALAGVRVVQHKETPGLGDEIDERKSDWITKFKNHSLSNTSKKDWAVKRDGGQFDQFTGATITPRAIVKAVYNTLRFYKENRESLYE
ncbi:MAG: electron transport complex subunit RsxG [Woeseiaceae bacterium]